MTEPTDAELDELRQANSGRLNFVTFSEFRTIARAVLAKWGAQDVPAAQGDALSDDAVRVPLDSLHADAAYLIGRLREGSMPYARVIEIIRERIDAAKAAIRARAEQVQVGWLVVGEDGIGRFWPVDDKPEAMTYCEEAAEPVSVFCDKAALEKHNAAQEGK